MRQDGRMPLIQISQTPGLTADQKRAAIAAVTAAYAEATGKNPDAVWVTLTDIPREAWGVGGKPLG
ncbi:4-oxalocrotonate tautomerase family protein [Antrihabitans sp. NCIMB 15449]|uniref:4-oxalocrotonate tautomerase family protein n=1 Tax=Antrihabitans spumae TaxID=3373370 RepID=A0ABW7JRX2_9NOCA